MSLNEQYIPLNLFLEKINKIKSQYSKNTKVKAQSMLGVVAAMAKESCLDIPKQHDIGCTIPEEYQKEHVLRYPDVSLSEIREAINAMAKNQRIEAIRCKIEEQEGMTVEDALKYAKEHKTGSILACLSGRGDKDIDYVYENYGCGEKFKLDYNIK